MQVSVEESGVIERKLTISVPSDDIQTEVNKRLKNVARNAKIPGFRPGKAPQSVIKKRYEPQVTNEVISETINSSYMDALGQEEIVPAGLVSIDPTPYEPGQDFQYVATVELFPQIPKANLEGKTISRPVVEVTKEDVDRTLEDIRTRNANYVSSEDAAAEGDKLTIDFKGTIGGEEFPGGNAEDFQFLLGRGQMLEEFDAGLTGAKPGEEKTVAFTFPENYGSEDIAGKDVEFLVSVKGVEKPELPELDDSFAETLGITEGGIEKMRTEIEANLNRELETRMRVAMRDRVMDELYSVNDIEIPKALIEDEINRAVQGASQQLEAQGLPTDKIDRSIYADEARKRVALGLIAREIVEKHEINADEDAVRAKVTEMAESYEDPEAFVNWHMSDQERRRDFEAIIIEEQIVEKMLESATVSDEKLSFQDFMNPQPAS